jgi:hypothetical protein
MKSCTAGYFFTRETIPHFGLGSPDATIQLLERIF